MVISHALASGMGGVRAAGDLVARMQMTRNMRLDDAKEYVADRLGVDVLELTDPVVMDEVREELGIGRVQPSAGDPKGMEAKHNISELLDIDINSVEKFRDKTS